jgi:hypothetical protein
MYRVTIYFERYVERLDCWCPAKLGFSSHDSADGWMAGVAANGIALRNVRREG